MMHFKSYMSMVVTMFIFYGFGICPAHAATSIVCWSDGTSLMEVDVKSTGSPGRFQLNGVVISGMNGDVIPVVGSAEVVGSSVHIYTEGKLSGVEEISGDPFLTEIFVTATLNKVTLSGPGYSYLNHYSTNPHGYESFIISHVACN